MASGGGPRSDAERPQRARAPPTGRWLSGALAAVAVVVLIAWGASPRLMPVPGIRAVRVVASQVLLNVSDIPDPNWGEWSSGTNGTGAWRYFSVHTEIILATLNVTLWVEPDAATAEAGMSSIVHDVSYAAQDGGVPGSDASRLWLFNFGQYGGMVVRRYNVVFLLSAHLETSFSLTPSDLGKWSGWQLAKIERVAVPPAVPGDALR